LGVSAESKKWISVESVADERVTGSFAARISVLDSPHSWLVASVSGDQPLRRGEKIILSFEARCLESDGEQGMLEVSLLGTKPWNRRVLRFCTLVGRDWARYSVPAVVKTTEVSDVHQSGEWEVQVKVGYQAQVLEIANLKVEKVPVERSFDTVWDGSITYDGREATAVWRAGAEERIRSHRMADLNVRVVDAQGDPVAGVPVHVAMQSHAYSFGSAVSLQRVLGTRFDVKSNQMYRNDLLKYFNQVSMEGALKWAQWDGTLTRFGWDQVSQEQIIEGIDWLNQQGFKVTGHNLVWPDWSRSPEHLRLLENDPSALQSEILAHINDEVSTLRGKVDSWIVINEMVGYRAFTDLMGFSAAVDWFHAAHDADPDARLFINDFRILADAAFETKRQDRYYEIINQLLQEGAPVDGIGMQCHFGWYATPIETVLDVLDRFAQFGLEIRVEEFDMDVLDEELQRDYLRDFLTAVFSHEATTGFTMWGFWDGQHCWGNAPLLRWDRSEKPAEEVWRDLVYKKWWSDLSVLTDEQGKAQCRVFKGSFNISVAGQETVGVTVSEDGTIVQITLDRIQGVN
jgi:GH35 family endo-1,4-beta-xylanase